MKFKKVSPHQNSDIGKLRMVELSLLLRNVDCLRVALFHLTWLIYTKLYLSASSDSTLTVYTNIPLQQADTSLGIWYWPYLLNLLVDH